MPARDRHGIRGSKTIVLQPPTMRGHNPYLERFGGRQCQFQTETLLSRIYFSSFEAVAQTHP
jgi:hypothetical protein